MRGARDVSRGVDEDARTAAALREECCRVHLAIAVDVAVPPLLKKRYFSSKLKPGEGCARRVGAEIAAGILIFRRRLYVIVASEEEYRRRYYYQNKNDYFFHIHIITYGKQKSPVRGFLLSEACF